MAQGDGVAQGGVDGESEEIADAADVTSGGVDFLEDAVFSERLRFERCAFPGELATDGREAWRGFAADEQMRVDAAGPGAGTPFVMFCPIGLATDGVESYA